MVKGVLKGMKNNKVPGAGGLPIRTFSGALYMVMVMVSVGGDDELRPN